MRFSCRLGNHYCTCSPQKYTECDCKVSRKLITDFYRNCVESAKASMVGNYAQENNGNNVCSDLDNMLGGCDDQVIN